MFGIPTPIVQLVGMLIVSIVVVYMAEKAHPEITELPTISNELEQKIYDEVVEKEKAT